MKINKVKRDVRSVRASPRHWLCDNIGSMMMPLHDREENLDAARFEHFSKSICEHCVLVTMSSLWETIEISRLTPLIDWIGDHVKSSWSLVLWAETETESHPSWRWVLQFSFREQADAVLFKLVFGGSGCMT